MAYTWYYKDGDTVEFPNTNLVKNQPNSNLRGNILHYDPLNGITVAEHADNPGIEENGSENFPFRLLTEVFTAYTTYSINYVLAAPTKVLEVSTAITGIPSQLRFSSDRKYFVFKNTGTSTTNCFTGLLAGQQSLGGFVNCLFDGFYNICSSSTSGQTPCLKKCKINGRYVSPGRFGQYSAPSNNTIYIGESSYWMGEGSLRNNQMFVNTLIKGISQSDTTSYSYLTTTAKPSLINCDLEFIVDYSNMSIYIDGGSIKVGSRTPYSIDTALAMLKTEAEIITEIEAEFDAEYGGTHTFSNLRIAVPGESALPFVNKNKGNYLFDVNNPLSETLYNAGYGIGVGYGIDFDSVEANSDFVNSITSPHYTTNDGFSGALYCRNINTDGSINNSADDAAWVSKEISLPSFGNLKETNFNGLLNSLDIGDQADLELYFAISAGSALEDVFNSTDYNFSYAAGALTIDFPRFNFGDAKQEVNKLSDIITNQIEKGSYNKDTGRVLFSNSGVSFRVIIVKRGV